MISSGLRKPARSRPPTFALAFRLRELAKTDRASPAARPEHRRLLDAYLLARGAKDLTIAHFGALDMGPNKRDKVARERVREGMNAWISGFGQAVVRLLPHPETKGDPASGFRALERHIDVATASALTLVMRSVGHKMSREQAESFVLMVQGPWYSQDEQDSILNSFRPG